MLSCENACANYNGNFNNEETLKLKTHKKFEGEQMKKN